MKTNTTIRPTPRRRTRNQPTAHRFRPEVPPPPTQRRLYTDFLTLAFYPGMNPQNTDSAA